MSSKPREVELVVPSTTEEGDGPDEALDHARTPLHTTKKDPVWAWISFVCILVTTIALITSLITLAVLSGDSRAASECSWHGGTIAVLAAVVGVGCIAGLYFLGTYVRQRSKGLEFWTSDKTRAPPSCLSKSFVFLGLLCTCFVPCALVFGAGGVWWALEGAAFAERTLTLELPGLLNDVQVIRENDGAGIHRLFAKTEEDVYFAQGVTHAQYRLWQMELMRRVTAGELAEILGPDLVGTDKAFRTVGFREYRKRAVASMKSSPLARNIVNSYIKGVNAYLDSSPVLPAEMRILGVNPRHWTMEDVAGMPALLSLQLSANADEEIVRYAMTNIYGLSELRVRQMHPVQRSDYPTVLRNGEAGYGIGTYEEGEDRYNPENQAEPNTFALNASIAAEDIPVGSRGGDYDDFAREISYAEIVADGGPGGGNDRRRLRRNRKPQKDQLRGRSDRKEGGVNEWVVASAKSMIRQLLDREDHFASNNFVFHGNVTDTGNPLLGNDPHLGLSSPAIWMLLHLRANKDFDGNTGSNGEPSLDTYGTSIPGIPGIVLGRTLHGAWGATTSVPDVQDMFEIEPAGGSVEDATEYVYNASTRAFRSIKHTIKVAGEDDVTITVRHTIHGPIINENEGLSLFVSSKISDELTVEGGFDKLLAFACPWAMDGVKERSFEAFMLANRAASFDDFATAFSYLSIPSQSFVVASDDGDIGYIAPGLIPIRVPGHSGYWVVPGNGSYDWLGFSKYEDQPLVRNPPRGWIATSNNRIAALPQTGSGLRLAFSNSVLGLNNQWRANRINALIEARLDNGQKISAEYLRTIQDDSYSGFAETLVPILKNVSESNLTSAGKSLRNQLLAWTSFNPKRGSRAGTTFALWRRKLLTLGVGDGRGEIPGGTGSGYWEVDMFVAQAMREDAERGTKDWSCIAKGYDSCLEFAASALNKVASDLDVSDAEDVPGWGDTKSLDPDDGYHPTYFANSVFGGTIFSCGAETLVRSQGDSSSPNKQQYRLSDPNLPSIWGPGLRHVHDLGLDYSSMIIGPGQSGNLFSRDLRSTASLWSNNRYLNITRTPSALADIEDAKSREREAANHPNLYHAGNAATAEARRAFSVPKGPDGRLVGLGVPEVGKYVAAESTE